jgi:adenylosuccinate lyase
LADDRKVTACIPKQEIRELLNPDRYTGTAVKQVERLHGKLSRKYLKG